MDGIKVILADQINLSADRAKILRVSGTQISYQNQTANGSVAGGSILFSNLALPSLANSCISRNMRISYRVAVSAPTGTLHMYNPNQTLAGLIDPPVVTGAVAGAPLGALRPFPLSTCTDTLIVTINNVPTSVSLRQQISGLLQTIPKDYLEKQATECPSQLDNASVLATDQIFVSDTTIMPASSQPLSTCLNSPKAVSRASFAPISVVLNVAPPAGGGNIDIFTFHVEEPVFCSPLTLYDDQTFLGNVNNLSVQYFYSSLTDMLVYGSYLGSVCEVPAVTVALVESQARLAYTIVSLDTRVVAVPRVLSYPYAGPQFFPTALTSFASPVSSGVVQTTGQVTSQSLRLSFMPSLIYIYGQMPPSTRSALPAQGYSVPDFYYDIGTPNGGTDQTNIISIQLNNRQGLGAGMSKKDLYRTAVQRGYGSSFNDWLASPIIILSPTLDLGIDVGSSDVYPNQSANVTLSIQCTFNNSNVIARTAQVAPNSLNWLTNGTLQFQIVTIQDGIFQISPDSVSIDCGALSSSEVKSGLEDASSGDAEKAFVPSSVEKMGLGGALTMFGAPRSMVAGVAHGLGGAMTGGKVRRR